MGTAASAVWSSEARQVLSITEIAERCSTGQPGAAVPNGSSGRYNTAVPAAQPQPPDRPSQERPPKSHIYKLEAAGILIIGAVVLMVILARYWHHIAWGAR